MKISGFENGDIALHPSGVENTALRGAIFQVLARQLANPDELEEHQAQMLFNYCQATQDNDSQPKSVVMTDSQASLLASCLELAEYEESNGKSSDDWRFIAREAAGQIRTKVADLAIDAMVDRMDPATLIVPDEIPDWM